MNGIFSDSLYASVAAAWLADQNHPLRRKAQRPPLDSTVLRQLIDVCYEASIQREEGRSVRFAISLPDEESLHENQNHDRRFEPLSFASPVAFSSQALRKLSFAIDPKRSSLLVRENSRSHDLEICGIALLGNRNRLREIPFVTRYSLARPEWLSLMVDSPGTITVARGGSKIGLVTAGKFFCSTPTPFHSRAMGTALRSALESDPGSKQYGVHYWQHYSYILDALVRSVAAEEHGGTLLILPSAKVDAFRNDLEFRYPVNGSLRFSSAILDRLALESIQHTANEVAANCGLRIALSDSIAERLEATAHFASIDGALVLTTELEVLGFGATLKARENWSDKVIVGNDGFSPHGEPFEIKKLGTRHNSAANFVGDHPGTFAFVVSSDGPIRGFTRIGHKVVVWPDFRASMFVE